MKKVRIDCPRLVFIITLITSASLSLNAQSKHKPVRENIEWLDVWMPNTNDSGLPRILLIGNSITRGYYPEVQRLLSGKAYVARLATSKSIGDPGLLKEIDLIMDYHQFDIIHFNNGLHGFGYTEEAYRKAFPSFIKKIRRNAPHAQLIWATITPIRTKEKITAFDSRTERIKIRNQIALDYIGKRHDIQVDDLWGLTIDNPSFYEGGDGTHPNPAGYKAIAEKVAGVLATSIEGSNNK